MKIITLKNQGQFLLLLLFLLTLAITLTINTYPLYIFDIRFLKIEEMTGLNQKTLLTNYLQLISYLNNPFIKTLKMDDFPTSASGTFHFYEVKRLFLLNYTIFLVTLIPAIRFVKELWKKQLLWLIKSALALTAIAPVVFGIIIFTAFDRFFILFHYLMFNNDDWLFDPATDPIIMALPEEYFFHCFAFAFLLFEMIILFLYVKSLLQLKNYKLINPPYLDFRHSN